MMNKQLAFVKSGLGLALCFLMVGAGVTPDQRNNLRDFIFKHII